MVNGRFYLKAEPMTESVGTESVINLHYLIKKFIHITN